MTLFLALIIDFQVPNAKEYYPLTEPAVGTALSAVSKSISALNS